MKPEAPSATRGGDYRVQRVSKCIRCGARVQRRSGARGPKSRRCEVCRERRRLRVQLKAYLATAARVAQSLGWRDLTSECERLTDQIARRDSND